MKSTIPKIIHQIWSGIDEPLPEHFFKMAETWKYDYPDWEYIFWDASKMNSFILECYPQYWKAYNSFPYNVQRWDVIRYLILYKMGGMYVDFDYESLKPMDQLLLGKHCCFSQEPASHCRMAKRGFIFNNSLMASVPSHIFMKRIIDKVFSEEILSLSFSIGTNKDYIFETTGQWMLIDLYENQTKEEQKDIYLIPPTYVSPFDVPMANVARKGSWDKRLEESIKNAYAIHYYFGAWIS